MKWDYKYILAEELPKYKAEGWEYVGPMQSIGGWKSVIVRRKV